MHSYRRQDIILLFFQIVVWIFIILAPAVVQYLIHPVGNIHLYLISGAWVISPFAILYFACFYLLIPRLYDRGRYVWFVLAVIALIAISNLHLFCFDPTNIGEFSEMAVIGRNTFTSVMISLDFIVVVTTMLHRNYIRAYRRQRELEEAQRKSTEAELVWLKNQLNPHFLFNSLNNISSLTQIDPDQAQEAIAQLSDLLRYALYESQKPLVPLVGEVEFMQNYIAMMKLRCSDKTEVTEDFQVGTGHEQIAPLLFVSFIENAFKHGTSSNQPSRICVRLHAGDGRIVFDCRNTNFPKGESDHSGSGIGLENTRRRLDLCYPGKYVWEQKIENEEYCIKIEITV